MYYACLKHQGEVYSFDRKFENQDEALIYAKEQTEKLHNLKLTWLKIVVMNDNIKEYAI